MNKQQRAEFRQYLVQCSNSQVQGVYDKEKSAGRECEQELAVSEAQRRGIELSL